MKNRLKPKASKTIIRKMAVFFLFLVGVKARHFSKHCDVAEGVEDDSEMAVEWGLSGKADTARQT